MCYGTGTYFGSVNYMKRWEIIKINLTGYPVLEWPDWKTDCLIGMVGLQVVSDELTQTHQLQTLAWNGRGATHQL